MRADAAAYEGEGEREGDVDGEVDRGGAQHERDRRQPEQREAHLVIEHDELVTQVRCEGEGRMRE